MIADNNKGRYERTASLSTIHRTDGHECGLVELALQGAIAFYLLGNVDEAQKFHRESRHCRDYYLDFELHWMWHAALLLFKEKKQEVLKALCNEVRHVQSASNKTQATLCEMEGRHRLLLGMVAEAFELHFLAAHYLGDGREHESPRRTRCMLVCLWLATHTKDKELTLLETALPRKRARRLLYIELRSTGLYANQRCLAFLLRRFGRPAARVMGRRVLRA